MTSEVRELVEAYVDAWSRRDVEAVAALLAEDAVFSMPPWAEWWQGRDTIASFAENEDCGETRTLPTPIRVNGQLGLASYSLDEETGRFVPAAIDVLTLEGGLIKEITAFITPELFPALRASFGARALTGSS